jgi:hypothetical protein
MRPHRVLLCGLAACVPAGASLAQAPLPGAPSLFRFAVPPAGFVALNASNAELDAYGLPPRPAFSVRNGRAMNAWVRAMSAAKFAVVPQVRVTGHLHRPALGLASLQRGQLRGQAAAMTSLNWTGQALTAPNTGFGANSFAEVMGQWVVSAVQQAVGSCSGTDSSSTWVGIDGLISQDVLQAGTEADAACSGGVTTQNIYAWFEWYPNYSYEVTNFPETRGSSIFVVVRANSDTSGTATFVNLQTNQYTAIGITPPSGTRLAGDSAEWIVERPALGAAKTLSTLADFGMIGMMSEISYLQSGVGGRAYEPGYPGVGQAGQTLAMRDASGNILATSTPQGTFAQFVFAAGPTL